MPRKSISSAKTNSEIDLRSQRPLKEIFTLCSYVLKVTVAVWEMLAFSLIDSNIIYKS